MALVRIALTGIVCLLCSLQVSSQEAFADRRPRLLFDANRPPHQTTVAVYGLRTLLGSTPARNRANTRSPLARFLPRPLLTTWTNALGIQDPLIRYDPHLTVEYVIVRKLAATLVDVFLLVASLCKNRQRNEPGRFIRSLEPTVGKDNLTLLPSSIRLQFVRKVQMLRHSDDV